MKFDKRLACYIAESSGQEAVWVSYKALKKRLKTFRRLPGEEGRAEHSVDKEAGEVVATEEREFVKKLDEDLAKLNDFFIEKEEESVIRLQLLTERLDAATFREEREDIRKAFVDFHGQLVLLMHWALLNYAAVAKILKKHDKVTGAGLKDPYLAAVLHQPFCSTGAISSLARAVENKVRELGPLGPEDASTSALPPWAVAGYRGDDPATPPEGGSVSAAAQPGSGPSTRQAGGGESNRGNGADTAPTAAREAVEQLPGQGACSQPVSSVSLARALAGATGGRDWGEGESARLAAGNGGVGCCVGSGLSPSTSRTSSCSDFALGAGLDASADAILRRTQAALGLWAELQHSAHTPSTVLPCTLARARSSAHASEEDEASVKRQRST